MKHHYKVGQARKGRTNEVAPPPLAVGEPRLNELSFLHPMAGFEERKLPFEP